MDPAVWIAWLRFTEEALKGAQDARRQFEQLAGGASGPETLARWLAQWMPQDSGAGSREREADLADAIERWWGAMGAVPRVKYDALLRQNQKLRDRLEETERKIAELRDRMAAQSDAGHREEMAGMLTEWERATREALDTQAEWAARWFGAPAGEKDER